MLDGREYGPDFRREALATGQENSNFRLMGKKAGEHFENIIAFGVFKLVQTIDDYIERS